MQRGHNRCFGYTVDTRVADISSKCLCTWTRSRKCSGPPVTLVYGDFMAGSWDFTLPREYFWYAFHAWHTQLPFFYRRGPQRHDYINVLPTDLVTRGQIKKNISPINFPKSPLAVNRLALTGLILMAINIYSIFTTWAEPPRVVTFIFSVCSQLHYNDSRGFSFVYLFLLI